MSLDPDQAHHLSGLIWVQIVCKGYQQTTLVDPTKRQARSWSRLFDTLMVFPIFFFIFFLGGGGEPQHNKSSYTKSINNHITFNTIKPKKLCHSYKLSGLIHRCILCRWYKSFTMVVTWWGDNPRALASGLSPRTDTLFTLFCIHLSRYHKPFRDFA